MIESLTFLKFCKKRVMKLAERTKIWIAGKMKELNTEALDTQLKYSIRLYCYGTVGMTKEWLLNDNTTSAETVVQMMFASMPENMKKIYF